MLNYYNSKVTIELRDVLKMTDENGSPFVLFDFDYPCFYEGDAKKAFEQKIIDHYLFHQIGVETVARFKHNFKTRIREIMPYYNQLYESVKIMDELDDPFGNLDVVETFEQTSNDTSTGESSATSTATRTATNTTTATRTATKTDEKTASEDLTHKFSNTPQGEIINLEKYLTEASIDNKEQTEDITTSETDNSSDESSEKDNSSGDTSASSSSTNTGTIKHTLTRKGNQGVNTYAHDMNELRQSFINVDMMVIGALRDLFLLIY